MTYKRADRPGWPRLRAQRFVCQRMTDTSVTGYATLLYMVEVAEPLWVTHNDQRICIADVGYSWLQIFPEGANYTHTTMFDAEGQPVQEYIDLVAEQGIDDAGIPWYDDLYLDITWIPEGSPSLLDVEELEAARAIGAITPEQYELARGETARLLVALTLGDYSLPEVTRACYPALRAALDEMLVAVESAEETADPGASADTTHGTDTTEIKDTSATESPTANPEERTPLDSAPAGESTSSVDSDEQPLEDGERDA